ncbi:MAG: circularly permuted type 2 ATP-grasp protein, partial [Burkholderiales bacterium]
FDHLSADAQADLNDRAQQLERQIRDNGVTYNVHADPRDPQRPWSLDLFPLIISQPSWREIEAGVLQRVRLLDRILADVYGPQQLLADALLPAALVQGHHGFLRAMHGVPLAADTHLHIAAFDLARAPNGHWWVVSQRTQAPSGLGYLLENRLAVSRVFAPAFQSMPVQHLAATYRALMDHLKRLCPSGEEARIALLTPGPYSETWFEHAYLARYLGLTLVEGSDLTVRGQRLYLKTLSGLEPVHALLKRVDDEYLDPLELRADSTLGVPGLLQAIRAGNVVVANAPGSAFLESPALLGFLPALSRHLLGEPLALPSLATWWCGEDAALEDVLPRLSRHMIKPTAPRVDGSNAFDAVRASLLSGRELSEWTERIRARGDEHTVQAFLAMSQMPTWQARADAGTGSIRPRSVMLRVFAVADGPRSWRVLPGGMARIATANEEIASMQRGGSSADVWVLTDGEVDRSTLMHSKLTPELIAERRHRKHVTSRASENLFWLGRYTERAEHTARLATITLEALSGEESRSPPLLDWIGAMAAASGLVDEDVPSAKKARRVFERSLIASLARAEDGGSVGFSLRAIRFAAAALRDRLSLEQWTVITRCETEFFKRCAEITSAGQYSPLAALRALEIVDRDLATTTGAQADRMMRDDGLRMLNAGRQIERLGNLAKALASAFETGAVHTVGGFDAVVALFDSTLTFRAHYQQSRDIAALLDLLVVDRANPRSLAWVAHNLRGRLAKIALSVSQPLSQPLAAIGGRVPDPAGVRLSDLTHPDIHGHYSDLMKLLEQCVTSAWEASERIGSACFTHSRVPDQSVGA